MFILIIHTKMSNMQLEIWGQSLEHTKILISESLRQKDIKLTETCFFFLMKSRLSAKIEDYLCRVLILGERWKRKLLKETAKKKSEK